MNFIPFLKINLQTKLNEKAVCEIIAKNTEPSQFIRSSFYKSEDVKTFEGKTNGNTFSIRKIYRSRNIFVPQIEGNIENSFGTTTINLKFRLQKFTIGILIFWLLGMSIAAFSIVRIALENSTLNGMVIAPLIFIVIIYIMMQLFFNFYTTNAKKAIIKITEAYENQ